MRPRRYYAGEGFQARNPNNLNNQASMRPRRYYAGEVNDRKLRNLIAQGFNEAPALLRRGRRLRGME